MNRLIPVLKRLVVFMAVVTLIGGSLSVTALAEDDGYAGLFMPEDISDPYFIDPVIPDPVVPEDPCAYGHDLHPSIITNPTCTEGGVTRYSCARCNYFEDHANEPPATGHVSDGGVVALVPTCMQDGIIAYHCVNCGVDMGTDTIPRLDHVKDSGTVVQQPTATATGKKVYSCVYCGVVLEEEVIPCIAKRDTPNALFDTSNAVLSNIPDNSTVTVNGNVINSGASGSIDLKQYTGSAGQYTIQIRANATGEKAESDVQTINTSKPGAPAGVTTKSVIIGQSNGSINGVDLNMEFKLQDGATWANCPNGSITVQTGGIYIVRYKATSTQLASDAVEALVREEEGKRPARPDSGFNGTTHTITNVKSGYVYSTNGGDTWTKVPNGDPNVKLSNDAVNQAITYGYILVKQTVPVESETEWIDVYRAATPTGITATPATNGNNGSIKGVGTDMQYRIEGGNSWFDIGSNAITGLAPNNYYIRRKAHGTTVESNEVKIVVSKGSHSPSQEGKPNAVFNAYNMVIDDISGCRLSFDCGASWTNVIYDHRYVLSENQVKDYCGIQVYKPGNGSTTTDSEKQYISLTKLTVPTGITAISATNNAYGSINGVDSSMQYRNINSNLWTDVPTGSLSVAVPAGTYYLRRHGYGNALASDALTVVIKTETNATPIVPSNNVVPTKDSTVDKKDKTIPTKDENGKETSDNGIVVEIDDSIKQEREKASSEETIAEDAAIEEGVAEEITEILSVELGWSAIEKTFETATAPVIVEINSATDIPSEVFTKAASTNTPLVLAVDAQAVWSVEPADISISDVSLLSSVDLGITENTATIPSEVLNTVEDDNADKKIDHTFDIKHEGNFGFTAHLTVKTNSDAIGKYANLYWYNKKSGKMEYMESSLVNSKAEATFKMTHASSYAIVISKEQMSAADVKEIKLEASNNNNTDNTVTSVAGNDTDNLNVKKPAKKSNLTIIVIVIILIVALIGAIVCAIFYSKRK